MPTLSEEEILELMRNNAYTNKDDPEYEFTYRTVKQGFKNLYPNDNRNKTPKEYYIWRTEGDERVRSEHADREGEVFCWDEAPSGGHPGEDWGCRCWAEDYTPPTKNMDPAKKTRRDKENLMSKVCEKVLEKLEDQELSNSKIDQIKGSIKDYCNNYIDMLNSNVKGNDSYFHCKANFEATSMGEQGELAAQKVGELKEFFDYWKNRVAKDITFIDALADYYYDLHINQIGRDQANSGLYDSAKAGCDFLRPNGLDEKY